MSKRETLSYSDGVKGWPSFYSYIPEFMVGMNTYFYTFKNGRLYRHNTNERRNEYYGILYSSEITGVFNTEPTTIKLFKTISIESNDAWTCSNLATDLNLGQINNTFFEKKEGEWFSYIRYNTALEDFKLRSTHGIGTIPTANLSPPTSGISEITLPSGLKIDNMISGGDAIYINNDTLLGLVTDLNYSTNVISVTNSAGISLTSPTFFFYYKNPQAESNGVRGYFMEFTLQNSSDKPVEMFSLGSSVMKSYP